MVIDCDVQIATSVPGYVCGQLPVANIAMSPDDEVLVTGSPAQARTRQEELGMPMKLNPSLMFVETHPARLSPNTHSNGKRLTCIICSLSTTKTF